MKQPTMTVIDEYLHLFHSEGFIERYRIVPPSPELSFEEVWLTYQGWLLWDAQGILIACRRADVIEFLSKRIKALESLPESNLVLDPEFQREMMG